MVKVVNWSRELLHRIKTSDCVYYTIYIYIYICIYIYVYIHRISVLSFSCAVGKERTVVILRLNIKSFLVFYLFFNIFRVDRMCVSVRVCER
jgi:hypothetical protein